MVRNARLGHGVQTCRPLHVCRPRLLHAFVSTLPSQSSAKTLKICNGFTDRALKSPRQNLSPVSAPVGHHVSRKTAYGESKGSPQDVDWRQHAALRAATADPLAEARQSI